MKYVRLVVGAMLDVGSPSDDMVVAIDDILNMLEVYQIANEEIKVLRRRLRR